MPYGAAYIVKGTDGQLRFATKAGRKAISRQNIAAAEQATLDTIEKIGIPVELRIPLLRRACALDAPVVDVKQGRNKKCACQSGKKYKSCGGHLAGKN